MAAENEEADIAELPCVPQVEQCRLALFAAGPPLYNTVITVKTGWHISRLHEEHTKEVNCELPFSRRPSEVTSHPGKGTEEVGACGPAFDGPDAFRDIVHEIERDFSILRAGNSSWLLWRVLDTCIDELKPILAAYRAQLRWFSGHIVQEEAHVSEAVEKRLLLSKVELDWLQRKVRPTVRVLKHLIHDRAIDEDVRRYLEDVEDHLTTFLEDVGSIIAVCNSLRDEVTAYRNRHQDKVLYLLTLVTIMVMPSHLLTGLYGMNFQDDAGKPEVPGLGPLLESRGYLLFWGFSFLMTAGIYIIFSQVLGWM